MVKNGEATSAVEVYYSKANRNAGIVILCIVPLVVMALPIITDQAKPLSPFIGFLLAALAFSGAFLGKLTSHVTVDGQGIRGRWYLQHVAYTWADVAEVSEWPNSLGKGVRISFRPRQKLIMRMSFSAAYDNFGQLKKLLEHKGYDF